MVSEFEPQGERGHLAISISIVSRSDQILAVSAMQ